MGSHVEPRTVTAGPTPLSLPDDSHDPILIGSAEPDEEIDILFPLSDEEHDLAHGQDREQNQNQENSSANDVLTDDLKNKIIKQVEYYFSDENLPMDKYTMSLIKKNKEGFVSISMIATFRRMKRLTRSYPLIVAALKESSVLVISSDGKKVRRRNPLPPIEVRDPKLFTVLVENLPEDHSVENIKRIFGGVGHIKNVSLHHPHAVDESKKNAMPDILVSSKVSNENTEHVGWPSVCSYIKNTILSDMHGSKSKASKMMYVKVSMDGVPIVRKIDLGMFKAYCDLSSALQKLFGETDRFDFITVYQDKDGDWMSAGDIRRK